MRKIDINRKLTVLWYEHETTSDVDRKEVLMVEIDELNELKNIKYENSNSIINRSSRN